MNNTGTDRPIILIERDGGLIEAIAGNVEANVIIIDSESRVYLMKKYRLSTANRYSLT